MHSIIESFITSYQVRNCLLALV